MQIHTGTHFAHARRQKELGALSITESVSLMADLHKASDRLLLGIV